MALNSEAVVSCINENCKSWHDNNLSLLASALLLRHFYVPSADGGGAGAGAAAAAAGGVETPHDPNADHSMAMHQHQHQQHQQQHHQQQQHQQHHQSIDNNGMITHTTMVSDGVNGINGVPVPNNTPTINNLITPSTGYPSTPDKNPNKTSTINALIHATTASTIDELSPKSPIQSTPNKQHSTPFTATPSGDLSSTSTTPIDSTPQDSIHHHTELMSDTPTQTPEYVPVNAAVPTRHVKECGHNIICILQKNNFSLSTSKKVSAASQQVYVHHVYPAIDASKTVLEVIAVVKEFWKLQMAPSPLSFCGLVTYMKNLAAPPQDSSALVVYSQVPMYPQMGVTICPPSPAAAPTPSRRKRQKVDPNTQGLPETGLLAQQLQICTDQNKTLQTRLASVEADLKNIHQICVQQECELKNIGQGYVLPKTTTTVQTGVDNELKVVPWPYGEKVVAVNHTLWQCNSPHAPPSYWFKEEQNILECIINEKEGDFICGYHVLQDILLMKVDIEWLKKTFHDNATRKADEAMQHLELSYPRFDGYVADTGEVGLFHKGFTKIARKMTLHRKLAV